MHSPILNGIAVKKDSRDNAAWLADLQGEAAERDDALADLNSLLVKRLPYGVSRYLSSSDPQFQALVEDTIQETLMRVINRLDSFEGRSQFTTWVYKIAIHIALNDLRLSRWRNVSLDALDTEAENPQPLLAYMASTDPSPETMSEQQDLMGFIMKLIGEELTSRQQAAIVAVSFQGVPMEEVARRLNTNRNALYKLIHDGRMRLKRRLEQEGLSPEELMTLFSKG